MQPSFRSRQALNRRTWIKIGASLSLILLALWSFIDPSTPEHPIYAVGMIGCGLAGGLHAIGEHWGDERYIRAHYFVFGAVGGLLVAPLLLRLLG